MSIIGRGYPAFIAAYAVLTLYASNADQLSLRVALTPLALALLLTAVLFALIHALSGNARKARLFTSGVLACFFAYGHLYALVYGYLRGTWRGTTENTSLGSDLHILLSILTAILLVMLWRGLRRSTRDLDVVEHFVGIFASILIAIPIGSIVFASSAGSLRTIRPNEATVEATKGSHPDIYLIVFDGYPRADALRFAFDFDNRPFQDSLRKLGFTMPDESRSNYVWTFLSLSSMLNMTYHDSLAAQLGPDSNDRTIPFSRIRENLVVERLRGLGYTYVHMNSTWNGTSSSQQADVALSCGNPAAEPFQAFVIQTSWLAAINAWLGSQLARCHLDNFDNVADAASLPGPKFVFAHFIPPHHPYLFNEKGEVLQEATVADQFRGGTLWDERDAFVAQLRFINDKIVMLVNGILSGQRSEAVILLVSDHGIRAPREDEQATLAVRFASFVAYRTPEGDRIIPRNITPVNLFRVIFNRYFGSDYDMLPNRHYASSWTKPYDFSLFDAEADSVFLARDARYRGQAVRRIP